MGLDPVTTGIIVVSALFVLMMLGVPIVYSLGFSGILGALLGYGVPALQKAGANIDEADEVGGCAPKPPRPPARLDRLPAHLLRLPLLRRRCRPRR